MLALTWSSSSHASSPGQTGDYTEITDPLSFIAVEEWRDDEGLAAHLRQPHVARLIAALPELGDGRPELAAHQVAASGPLPLPG
jgi:quinol monooxygenase YgiN